MKRAIRVNAYLDSRRGAIVAIERGLLVHYIKSKPKIVDHMKTSLQYNLIALGLAILAAASFSGCAGTGNSFDGTHTISGPQNTTFTVPNGVM